MPSGTSGNDRLTGGADSDDFDISQGGNDTVLGKGGDDFITAGAKFNANDRLDGGEGRDVLILEGDYAAGVGLTAANCASIEEIRLVSGFDYTLKIKSLSPGAEQAGGTLIQAETLGGGDRLVVEATTSKTALTIIGGAGDDLLRGGTKGDRLVLGETGFGGEEIGGGDDSAYGGGGDDVVICNDAHGRMLIDGGKGDDLIDLGSSFTVADRIEGGLGYDILAIGDLDIGYAKPIALGSVISGIEEIKLAQSFSGYNLKILGSFAADPLQGLTINMGDANFESSVINAAAVKDFGILFLGGYRAHLWKGGAGDDVFDTGASGSTVLAGAGDDVIHYATEHNDTARLNGGAGFDTLYFTGHVALAAQTIVNVETIVITEDFASITFDDGNLAAGRLLVVDASESAMRITLNGSAESSGAFSMIGGAGNDIFSGGGGADTMTGGTGITADEFDGGAGSDSLVGGTGQDLLVGGSGADRFTYLTLQDSTLDHRDLIDDLESADLIDLAAIDANLGMAGNQAFQLRVAFTHAAGQAVLSYDSGADKTLLSLDVNGDAVADAIIEISGNHLSFTNFVL